MPTQATRAPAPATATRSTTAVRRAPHNLQEIAAVIHVGLRHGPERLVVHPEPAILYYRHHLGDGDEMRPHRLLWLLDFGRHPGEILTIRLNRVTHPPGLHLTNHVFDHAFATKTNPHGPAVPHPEWTIAPDENAVLTASIRLASDQYERIAIKYDIVLTGTAVPVPVLDPGFELVPDP